METNEIFDLQCLAGVLERKLDGARIAKDMHWEDADSRLIEATRIAVEISNILFEATEGRALR